MTNFAAILQTSMPPILEAHGLTKCFGTTRALDGLELTVQHGQPTAILGPNGAGKTTLIRMFASLLRPDAGSLTVAGIDAVSHPARVRRVIGLAGQSAAVEGAMTARENLEFVGRLYGHHRWQARASAAVVLERLAMTECADQLVRTYSGGMRRKLDLAVTLVGAPQLLLLDEPTTGLDPRSRNEVWELVRDLVATGTEVLLTTQYLDEADHLAARIVIVDHGRVIAEGTPDELKSRGGLDVIEVHVADPADLQLAMSTLAPFGAEEPRVDAPTRAVAVPVTSGAVALLAAVRALDQLGVPITDVALRRPTLDEVFLALTGRSVSADADATSGGAVPTSEGPRPRRRAA
jgi:ABC-2 type transport system ATP-binding protein